ncbi:MAG: diguanylate cyclase [Archangium sp.]|nr:diguanylate cyclase [Archangium sp.]
MSLPPLPEGATLDELPPLPPGATLDEPGNIDLDTRPRVKNADGSTSTVRSMSFEEDGREVLIPTVSDDGRVMTDEEAISSYRQSGKHLGKFPNPEEATRFAERLHESEAAKLEVAPSITGFTAEDISKETRQAQRTSTLRVAWDAAQKSSADDATATAAIAKQLGVSFDTVRANLPAFRAAAKAKDFEKWQSENAELADTILAHPQLGTAIITSPDIPMFVKAWRVARRWREDLIQKSLDTPEKVAAERKRSMDAEVVPSEPVPMTLEERAAGKDVGGLTPKQLQAREGARAKEDVPKPEVQYLTPEAAALREVAEKDPSAVARFGAKALGAMLRVEEAYNALQKSHTVTRLAAADVGLSDEHPEDLLSELVDAELKNRPLALGDEHGIWRDVAVAGQALASSAEIGKTTLQAGGAGYAAGAIVGGGAALAITKSPAAAAEAAHGLGSLVGGKTASAAVFIASSELEGSEMYESLRGSKTENDTPVPNEVAFIASYLVVGPAAGALESLSFGKMATPFKRGLPEFVTGLVKRDPAFRELLSRAFKQYRESVATETTTEFLQDGVHQVFDYLTKSAVQEEWQSKGYNVEQGLEAAGAGAAGAVLLGAAGGAHQVATFKQADARAEVDDRQVGPLLAAADIEAVKADPDAWAETVKRESTKDGKAITAGHVDGEKTLRLLQEEGLTGPEAIAKVRELAGDQAAEDFMTAAITPGGKFPVPMAKFLSTWGGSELGKTLKDDTTLDASSPTISQRKEQGEAIKAEAKRIADEEVARTEEATLLLERQNEVVRQLTERGMKKGEGRGEATEKARAAAKLITAFARTAGVDFEQAASAVFPQTPFSFHQGDDALTGAPGDHLLEHASKLTEEERALGLFADPLSGLRNEEAFNATPLPAGHEVGVMTLVDAKAINDAESGGHDTTNKALAQMGGLVAGISPDAARGGTNFFLPVKGGQQGLEEAMAKVRAGLPAGATIEGALGANSKEALTRLDESTLGKRAQGLTPEIASPVKLAAVEASAAGDTFKAKQAFTEEERKVLQSVGLMLSTGNMTKGQVAAFKAEVTAREKLSPEDLQSRQKSALLPRGQTRMAPAALADASFTGGAAKPNLTPAHREAGRKATAAEYIAKALRDPVVPELLTRAGFETEQHPFVAAYDLRGLKLLNDTHGKALGDRVIEAFGQAMVRAGGQAMRAAHFSGDEYAAGGRTRSELDRFNFRLEAELARVEIPVTVEGQTTLIRPFFRTGIAEKTYGNADKALNAGKRAEAAGAHDGGRVRDVPGGQPGGGVHARPDQAQAAGDRRPDRADRAAAGSDAEIPAWVTEDVDQHAADTIAAREAHGPLRSEEAEAIRQGFNLPEAIATARMAVKALTTKPKKAPAGETQQGAVERALDAKRRLEERVGAATAFLDWVENTGPGLGETGVVGQREGVFDASKEVKRTTELWLRNDFNIIDPESGLSDLTDSAREGIPDDMRRAKSYAVKSTYARELKKDRQQAFAKNVQGRFNQDETAGGPKWFSQVERAVEGAKQEKNTGAAWWAYLQKAPGVKAEELEFLGIKEWLLSGKDSQGMPVKSLTKSDLSEFLLHNKVVVTEQQLADPGESQRDRARRIETTFNSTFFRAMPFVREGIAFVLKDVLDQSEENLSEITDTELQKFTGRFRDAQAMAEGTEFGKAAGELERLLEHQWSSVRLSAVLRPLINELDALDQGFASGEGTQYHHYKLGGEEQGSYREILFYTPKAEGFDAPHFGSKGEGLLAHARVSIHKDAAGERVLFVEEVQSDLHQQGRDRGYVGSVHATEEAAARANVPDAPFKQSWEELVAKRVLMLAAEQGIKKIGWTTGATQAARYDLAKQVDAVMYQKKDGGTFRLVVWLEGKRHVLGEDLTEAQLEAQVGKDVAKRIVGDEGAKTNIMGNTELRKTDEVWGHLSGDGLKIGGEGMKAAYDVRLPSVFKKLVKKDGGTVQQETLGAGNVKAAEHKFREAAARAGWTAGVIHSTAAALKSQSMDPNIEIGSSNTDPLRIAAIALRDGARQGTPVWTATLPDALSAMVKEKGQPLFQDEPPGGAAAGAAPKPPKGYTEVPATRRVLETIKVFLNKSFDASTVFHETAHGFLEHLGDLAEREDAPQRTKATYAAALKWLGVENREGITREHHEKWARTFEAYLYEGKAPSAQLAAAFQKFKLWLTGIYRSLQGIPQQDLNDDVRRVFDALLATEDELEAMKKKQGVANTAKPKEVSAEEWAAKLEEQRDEMEELSRKAQMLALKDRLRVTEKWWKDGIAKAEEEAAAEYEELPARQAQLILQGEHPVHSLTKDPVLLDRAAVEKAIGKKRREGVRTEKGGVNPDSVAELAGFPTGDAMLKALLELRPRDAWVKETARQRMEAAHPTVLEERTELRKLVQDALAGYTEKRLLAEQLVKGPEMEVLRRAAAQVVERRQLGQLNPHVALARQRAASKAKAEASAKGEWAAAHDAARAEALNAHIYSELLRAREQREKLEKRMVRMGKKDFLRKLGKAASEYRDAIIYLLQAVGAKEADASLTDATLPAVVAQMNGDAAAIGDPEWLEPVRGALERIERERPRDAEPDLSRMTVAEARSFAAALKHIEQAASDRTEVTDGEKRASKEEVVNRFLVAIAAVLPKRKGVAEPHVRTIREKLRVGLNGIDGQLLSPVDMVRDLTGDDQDNVLTQYIVNPVRRAAIREADLRMATLKPVMDALEALPKAQRKRWGTKVDGKAAFPTHVANQGVVAPRYFHEKIGMALNSGSESSLQVLTEGRNISEAEVRAFLSDLSAEDIAYVNTVHAAINSLREEAFALEERMTGARPKAVEARPMVLPNGTLTGGYYPLKAIKDGSQVGARMAGGDMAQLFDPTYTSPSTPHGWVNERTGATYPVSLDLAVGLKHVQAVVHDITHREVVKSVASLVLDKKVAPALQEHLGAPKAAEFLKWLKDLGGATAAEHNTLDRVGDWVRSNFATSLLSGLGTAASNWANLPTAVASTKLKAKHLAAAVAQLGGDTAFGFLPPTGQRKLALEKSGILRAMDQDAIAGLKGELRDPAAGQVKRGLEWVREAGMAVMKGVDTTVSTAVWLGAYRQALAEEMEEGAAVRFADDVLLQVQPTSMASERAGILRNKTGLGAVVMFYGYLSVAYRAQHRIAAPLSTQDFQNSTPGQKAWKAAKVAAQMAAFYIAFQVLGELLAGRGPEDGDDDEEKSTAGRWSRWFARKMVTAPLATLPVAGSIFSAGVDSAATGKPLMAHQRDPVSSALLQGVTTLLSVGAAAHDPTDAKKDKALKELLRTIGTVTGLPTRFFDTSVRYMLETTLGEREVPNVGRAVGGIVYGERENQPDNIPQALGDGLDPLRPAE